MRLLESCRRIGDLGRERYAEALIALVGPDHYGRDRMGTREPDHLPDRPDPGRGRLPGRHHDHDVGCPCRQVLPAERRIEGYQGKQDVRRITGGNEGFIGLSQRRES